MKRAAAALAAVVVAGVLAACGSSGSSSSNSGSASSSGSGSSSSGGSKAPIKIGVDVSLTGPFGPLGTATKNGIELAANQINAAGGVGGRKIQLTVLDDATNPATSIGNTNRLISGGSDAIIGYNGGQTQVPTAGLLVRHHVLTVALSGDNPGQPTGPAYFFAAPTFTTHLGAFACYVTKSAHAKDVSILHTNDAGTTAVATLLTPALKADGVTASSEVVPLGATDVTVAASTIRDAKPALIFDNAVGATGGLAVKTLRSLGVKTPIFGWLAWEQAPILKLYSSALNGVAMEGFLSPTNPLPYQKAFLAAWDKAYPSAPADAYAGWGYDSLEATAAAFKAVPGATQSDGLALGKAMEKINYRGVVGNWKLGPYNAKDPDTHTGMHLADVVWYTIENGNLVPLKNQPNCA